MERIDPHPWLIFILFWGLLPVMLILLVRWIARLPQKKESRQVPDKSPLDILNERLAKGEVEVDDYKEKRQMLLDSKI